MILKLYQSTRMHHEKSRWTGPWLHKYTLHVSTSSSKYSSYMSSVIFLKDHCWKVVNEDLSTCQHFAHKETTWCYSCICKQHNACVLANFETGLSNDLIFTLSLVGFCCPCVCLCTVWTPYNVITNWATAMDLLRYTSIY